MLDCKMVMNRYYGFFYYILIIDLQKFYDLDFKFIEIYNNLTEIMNFIIELNRVINIFYLNIFK